MKFLKKMKRVILWWLLICAVLLVLALLTGSGGVAHHGSLREMMRDAVLHNVNKIDLFGIKDVNPGLISAFTVTGALLVIAAAIRIFAIPRFKIIPGRFQMLLEELVSLFDNMARGSSPHRNTFLGAYIFAAGVYIFSSTIFELFGLQATTTGGVIMSLPAPLSDINGAIALGCLSYLVILSGGIAGAGFTGVKRTLKEFSLPISMSFRLFGALLSGLLVTELVYYSVATSIILPVFVGVLFTLLHALVQSYVLIMLTSLFYGEVAEPVEPKTKK